MSEPIFFQPSRGVTVAEAAALTGSCPRAGTDATATIYGVSAIEIAGPRDLVFVETEAIAARLVSARAGICIAASALADLVPARIAVLIADDPYAAFVKIAQALFPSALRPSSLAESRGIAAGAHVNPTVRLEQGVTIDPGAIIGPRAEIGADTVIQAGAVIGPGVRIGRGCTIGANATIAFALIGDRVRVHAGCRIGEDGVVAQAAHPARAGIPHVGRVIIQDGVEIGAGTAIQRGLTQDTVVGEGCKIDNLVQVGQNAAVGRYCTLTAQSGIAAGAVIEDFAVLGARVGVGSHVVIGEGARIADAMFIRDNVPAGSQMSAAART